MFFGNFFLGIFSQIVFETNCENNKCSAYRPYENRMRRIVFRSIVILQNV